MHTIIPNKQLENKAGSAGLSNIAEQFTYPSSQKCDNPQALIPCTRPPGSTKISKVGCFEGGKLRVMAHCASRIRVSTSTKPRFYCAFSRRYGTSYLSSHVSTSRRSRSRFWLTSLGQPSSIAFRSGSTIDCPRSSARIESGSF